jgi:hypothetical protein
MAMLFKKWSLRDSSRHLSGRTRHECPGLDVHSLERLCYVFFFATALFGGPLQITTFQSDVTPPLGTPLCFALVPPGKEVVDPLTARGIVIAGSGKPIILVAVDWVGISNQSHERWRRNLAEAIHTTIDRVSVHVLHQHDAPGDDYDAWRMGRAIGELQDETFTLQAMDKTVQALRGAMSRMRPVSHVGVGEAKVEKVASNRRVMGADGKVQYVRYSSSRIPQAIAAPEGTIDPLVRSVSFWNDGKPLAELTYYATHPQSYYAKGGIGWDFVGIARSMREKAAPGFAHIHFNGAAGNVTAGKYNNGDPEMRPELARRLADGMAKAWRSVNQTPISDKDVEWRTTDVVLPLRAEVDPARLRRTLGDVNSKVPERLRAARDLSYADRVRAGKKITISSLRIGPQWIIHMPGELFIEYQLKAQDIRPGVAMAAYGDLGPGYIGTAVSYGEGGYETGVVSRVGPATEPLLVEAMKKVLSSR